MGDYQTLITSVVHRFVTEDEGEGGGGAVAGDVAGVCDAGGGGGAFGVTAPSPTRPPAVG